MSIPEAVPSKTSTLADRLHWLASTPGLLAMARRVHPGRGPALMRRRLRLWWTVGQEWPLHRRWSAFLQSRAELQALVAHHPRVWRKPYAPLQQQGLAPDERAARLMQHYELARQMLGPRGFASLYTPGQGLDLGGLPLSEGHGLLGVWLVRDPHHDAAGEMTLQLRDPFGTPMASAALSLQDGGGAQGPVLLVGGLFTPATPETLHHLEGLMHGLSAGTLLLALVRLLGRHLGAGSVQLVPEAQQVPLPAAMAGQDALALAHGAQRVPGPSGPGRLRLSLRQVGLQVPGRDPGRRAGAVADREAGQRALLAEARRRIARACWLACWPGVARLTPAPARGPARSG